MTGEAVSTVQASTRGNRRAVKIEKEFKKRISLNELLPSDIREAATVSCSTSAKEWAGDHEGGYSIEVQTSVTLPCESNEAVISQATGAAYRLSSQLTKEAMNRYREYVLERPIE